MTAPTAVLNRAMFLRMFFCAPIRLGSLAGELRRLLGASWSHGCLRAWVAVMRFLGSTTSRRRMRSLALRGGEEGGGRRGGMERDESEEREGWGGGGRGGEGKGGGGSGEGTG